eukprot:TRINITY_DN36785_c0_g1_i1.p1 TRINITY_DN36785_c0_g1~~TRINITY_DN36785_c0_g1_i1.p1  ORF type:complete len:522 (-),score=101.96 TRINITY_DN36785_c0_g1_i1:75-1640(-)
MSALVGKRDGIRLKKAAVAGGYRDSSPRSKSLISPPSAVGIFRQRTDDDDDDEEGTRGGYNSLGGTEGGGVDMSVPLSMDGRKLAPRRHSNDSVRKIFNRRPSDDKSNEKGFPIYFTLSMALLIGLICFLIVCVVEYNLHGQVGWGSSFDPNAQDTTGTTTSTCPVANYTSFCSTSLNWVQERFADLIFEPYVPPNHEITYSWNTTFNDTDMMFSYEQIDTTPSQTMTMIVGKRADMTNAGVMLPVMIYIHSTNTVAQDMYDNEFLQPFVQDGYLTIAIDQRYHGRRVDMPNFYTNNTGPYYTALLNAWKNGRSYPYIYDTVQDVIRLLDYLETRDDVDLTRIGITGISSGGHIAWRSGVADDRISAVATIIGVEDTRNSLENDIWYRRVWTISPPFIEAAMELQGLNAAMFQSYSDLAMIDPNIIALVWGRINPGILDEQNAANALAAISPRPLFVLAGQNDTQNGDPDAVVAISQTVETQYMTDGADGMFQFYQRPNSGHALWPGFNDQILQFMNAAFM